MSVVVMGVGNTFRGDDGIGPAVVAMLLEARADAILLDCGTAPESFIGVVECEKPRKVIIVDAVDMQKEAGTVEIIDTDRIGGLMVSTHKLPLGLTVEQFKRSGVNIVFVGIQPKSAGFGKSMSDEVKKAATEAKELVLKEIYGV